MITILLIISRLSAETIMLENKDVLQGTIINYTNESITIETESGVEEIPISSIHLINYLSSKDLKKFSAAPNRFVLYLQNGEIIEGMITQFSNEQITIESLEGYGVLQIPTSNINYITSGQYRIDMNQRSGIGYFQKKSTLESSAGRSSYSSNQISYKYFLNRELFGDILLAYGNASISGNKIQVFSVDYRMGLIFQQLQNMFLYYGGSVGYLQINDDTTGVDGTGTSFSAFIGAEMFFPSLPNFGFSGEIGYGMQKAGNYNSSDLSISTFPAFSIHYYF